MQLTLVTDSPKTVDDDGACFYKALEQTRCAFVACDRNRVTVTFCSSF